MDVNEVAAATDPGRRMARNEDALLELREVPLFGVADGTGGVRAARVALAHLAAHAGALSERARAVIASPDTSSRLAVARFFEQTLSEAADAVRDQAAQTGGRMTTTVAAATVIGRFAYLVHVGNSRGYLYRDGRLRALTSDHTLAMEQLRKGEISAREFAHSPYRKTLTQALGATPVISPDIAEVLVAPGDRFLLCTDGLHGLVSDREIARVLSRTPDLHAAAEALIASANAAGGRDNISVLLFSVGGAADATEADSPIDVAESLERVFLFRGLSEAERLLVAPYFEHQRFAAGQDLCREGDHGDSFFVVVSGRATITRGQAKLIELEPGGYAGEISLARRGPRTATISALEPTDVLVLSRHRFLELIRRRPSLGAKLVMPLLDNVGGRLQDLRARLRAVSAVIGDGSDDGAL